MPAPVFEYLGRGAFSVSEAARLTGIPARRVHRWLAGYEYRHRDSVRFSPPPLRGDYPTSDGHLSLSFADMIEVRFLDHFLRTGVSWPTIRIAAEKAAEILSRPHPFSSRAFKTDGRVIMVEIAEKTGAPQLLDLTRNQIAFKRILDPYLYRGLEFSPRSDVVRWWPDAGARKIVIDPERSLGRPILARWGIPTATLASAVRVEGSVETVAAQFEIPRAGVAAALEFEERLAAA